MKRKYLQFLINWKNKSQKKPLLLSGARQVGKTFLIKEFGKEFYSNTIYLNFQTNKLANNIFNEVFEPNKIIKELEILFRLRIEKKNTLIIFDEIQENPHALNCLKYFCEDEPDYEIIGAGSLLGVYLNHNNYSFPVGKVETLTIYPLDFEEFLLANDEKLLIDEIRHSFNNNIPLSKFLHEFALDLYHEYLGIGGMPEVVHKYLTSNSKSEALEIQANIISNYRSDMTKYAPNSTEANRILTTFDSIPNQLAKENKKFQYKLIKKGGSASIFGDSINWLVNAGIINTARELTPIIGGILAVDALATKTIKQHLSNTRHINIGCAIKKTAFIAYRDVNDRILEVDFSNAEESILAFFYIVLDELYKVGTVAGVDIRDYADATIDSLKIKREVL